MKLIDDLLESVHSFDCKVESVRIGLHWTAVQSRYVGMAHTYKTGRKVEIEGSGNLTGGGALHLAERLRSWEPLEASLGLAALNSLIEPRGEPGNVNEYILKNAPDKTVTVVGRFPFNQEVARVAGKAYFLEMEPKKGELPPFACEEVIPQSDIVVITATALINKTLHRLLELGSEGKCIVLGPSTPMNEVLFDHGAYILAGVRVTDADALASSVTQGVKKFKKLTGITPIMWRRRRHIL